MNVELVDPRSDPEPAGWSVFQRCQRLYPVWDYGLMGIESRAAANPTLLALARLDGQIVAAFAVMVCRRGVRWLEVHHSWLVGFPGWVMADSVDPLAGKEIVRAFERVACRAAGIGCAGLVYRYVPPASRDLVEGWGRVVRPAMSNATLDNVYSTVDEWVSSLWNKRRWELRRQVRKVIASGLAVRFEAARADLDGSELTSLLSRHRARFGRARFDSRGVLPAEYLHALVSRDDVLTLTYHDDGRLMAFAIVLDHPEMPLYQHWATLSREEGGLRHLYFDSYHHLARHMIDGRRKALSSGGGMLELKAELGFTARPRQVLIVPRVVAG
jgi:predicted N-acyltransferase